MSTGHLNYFEVQHCGLYKVGDKAAKSLKMAEAFREIVGWTAGRSLVQTLPWDPLTSKKGISLCYCKDTYSDRQTGDFLLVLWKSETGSNSPLLGAEEEVNTGSNKVHKYTSAYKGNKVIWGRPCYYWVVPSKDLIISIKFDHSSCDSKMFQTYIKSCIENRVTHKDRATSRTGKDLVRISHNSGNYKNLLFRFGMHLMSLDSSSLQLNKLVPRITNIIKRETITVKSDSEKATWLKYFDKLDFIKAKPNAKHRHIEIKAEAKPSVQEVKNLIEEFAVENRSNNEWDNVGFVTDTGTTWADRYRLRNEISLDEPTGAVYTAAEIWGCLEKNRDRLLVPETTDQSASLQQAS